MYSMDVTRGTSRQTYRTGYAACALSFFLPPETP